MDKVYGKLYPYFIYSVDLIWTVPSYIPQREEREGEETTEREREREREIKIERERKSLHYYFSQYLLSPSISPNLKNTLSIFFPGRPTISCFPELLQILFLLNYERVIFLSLSPSSFLSSLSLFTFLCKSFSCVHCFFFYFLCQ